MSRLSLAFPLREALRRHRAWLLVALAVLFVIIVRVRLRDMPLERDEGEYAYAGQLILQGVPPYKEAYNMKLPGTYAAYAAIMAVFGQSPSGIHLGLTLVNAGHPSAVIVRTGSRAEIIPQNGDGLDGVHVGDDAEEADRADDPGSWRDRGLDPARVHQVRVRLDVDENGRRPCEQNRADRGVERV